MIDSNSSLVLPIIDGAAPTARRDAVRNRATVLDAAIALIGEAGTSEVVTMSAVAERAGVGKGTVFRRFGSRAGLMLALLERSEQEFQAAVISGPPPLGPGAAPIERLAAFGRARLVLIPVQGEMLIEAANELYNHGAYWVMVTHVQYLLRQLRPHADTTLTAQFLIAGLDARLVLHQIHVQHIPLERIADAWETMARKVAQ